jgi:hypothetical protein
MVKKSQEKTQPPQPQRIRSQGSQASHPHPNQRTRLPPGDGADYAATSKAVGTCYDEGDALATDDPEVGTLECGEEFGTDPGADSSPKPAEALGRSSLCLVPGQLPPGTHMKCGSFNAIPSPICTGFFSAFRGEAQALDSGLVGTILGLCWSRKMASPNVEEEGKREAGRRAISMRNRVPALG